jgi:hypothetical protein
MAMYLTYVRRQMTLAQVNAACVRPFVRDVIQLLNQRFPEVYAALASV